MKAGGEGGGGWGGGRRGLWLYGCWMGGRLWGRGGCLIEDSLSIIPKSLFAAV